MMDKELHKLRKTELLEVLFQIRKELDDMKAKNAVLEERLKSAEDVQSTLEEILAAVKPERQNEEQVDEKDG
ncbi:MAG: hypothetical protein LUF89_08320 [Ruminococcus sp.]|nr:hypothetical protein [Ruminococcus sp.]